MSGNTQLNLFNAFINNQSDILIGMPTLILNSVEKHTLSKLSDEEFMNAIAGMLLQLHPKSNSKDEPYLNDASILGEFGRTPINATNTLRDVFQLYIVNNLVNMVSDADCDVNSIDLGKIVDNYTEGTTNFIDTVRAIPHGVDNYLFTCNQAVTYSMLFKKCFF